MPRRVSRRHRSLLAASIAGLALILAAATPRTSSQEKPKAEDRKKISKPELESKSPSAPPQRKGFTIGVNVDLVVIHATVVDKNGYFVSGLKKESFSVFEDGVGQQITYFGQEDVPVSLGIVMDTSGSMRSKIEFVTKSALSFIRASNPEDEVFLVGFNDQIELLEDYTNDLESIADTLNNVVVTGGTALYDALFLAVQKAQDGVKPKKALVLISDGEDRDSYYKLEELDAKVQESDVQIYSIGFLNPIPDKGLFGKWSKSVPEKAKEALGRISEDTGAKAYFPAKIQEMGPIVAEIAHGLRNQYSIGYVSTNPARDGAYRRLKVSLDPATAAKAQLRYRRGYSAPKAVSE
jgi:Ca-activated chloride channel homolog